MVCGIYCITNKKNGSKYIGQAVDIYKRWKEHRRRPFSKNKKKRTSCKALYSAIRKHGIENFKFRVLWKLEGEQATKEELDRLEILFIKQLNTFKKGYNCTAGGGGRRAPCKEETKKKMSEAKTGEKNPGFGRTGEKHPNFGRTGEKSPNFGKKRSEESNKKTMMNNPQRKPVYGKRKADTKWQEFPSGAKAAKHFGCHQMTVSKICNKKRSGKRLGLDFKFVQEIKN